ncbi:class I SAM-dependent methyltransferase [Phytoactinopolyspora halotolerans]|uniref:Class I SAM-dependent methyltransferase n=1 Tax=Phytoactinopolyspora halotolerans TaxID=1981512 RepID=A0A6L9S7R9_9ACTN|nr:class I SAM-dependent methyltransferase [Phytoactinopolyspora halotolerans]NEE01515.1 class I SAM-dependent methyltransferase [Phytoactinopolyspora halotolerans]
MIPVGRTSRVAGVCGFRLQGMARIDASTHDEDLVRVYGPATWQVYDELDISLNPRGPDWLHDLAADLIPANGNVIDAGCRDAAHLVQLMRAHPSARGFGIDPVPLHVEKAQSLVVENGLQDRVEVMLSDIESAATTGKQFDFVWCRDVLEQVADLQTAARALASLTRPTGTLLVFTTVATDLLSPDEAAMLKRHLANVPANLSRSAVEDAFPAAGLDVIQCHEIGTEWREWAEERHAPASTALLRLARLRRDRARLDALHGSDIVDHVEANLHWEIYQFIGKLASLVYVLRPTATR